MHTSLFPPTTSHHPFKLFIWPFWSKRVYLHLLVFILSGVELSFAFRCWIFIYRLYRTFSQSGVECFPMSSSLPASGNAHISILVLELLSMKHNCLTAARSLQSNILKVILHCILLATEVKIAILLALGCSGGLDASRLVWNVRLFQYPTYDLLDIMKETNCSI